MNRKTAIVGVLLLALPAWALALPSVQMAGVVVERLTNGDFEEGFGSTALGLVGTGWRPFSSGGDAAYGFYKEEWAPVVYSGKHSQLIEINTRGYGMSQPDHYAGIYQTVAVVPGTPYELTLHGMLRALEEDPDICCYNYRVQVGVDSDGGASWEAVDNWLELPWDTVYPRLSPGTLESFSTTLTATGTRLTLFVRVWYKWGTVGRELDVNLDAISLKGALPVAAVAPATSSTSSQGAAGQLSVSMSAPPFPVVGWSYKIPVQGKNEVGVTQLEFYDNDVLLNSLGFQVGPLSLSHDFTWQPASPGRHVLKVVAYDVFGSMTVQQVKVNVSEEVQFLSNGGFESGFSETPAGMVGKGWSSFENGGQAAYGFYDETWGPVVADGEHSQMIEINTYDRGVSDADRYAGIYQTVKGLTRGATYRLSVQGMLRVLADDVDRENYGYRVQWGFTEGATDWKAVSNWVEIPWDTIYTRLDPGGLDSYRTAFQAPSPKITLFLRVWKKWGTLNRELDTNLDAIKLYGYK